MMRAVIIGAFISGIVLCAQAPTLRQRVDQEHADVATSISVDGPPVLFSQIIRETDRIVRGTVVDAVGHLTTDERDVFTTYRLTNARVIFPSRPTGMPPPGVQPAQPVVMQPGGSVRVDGFTATVRYDDAAAVSPGMDVVAFIHDVADKHWIAGRYGVFEIRDGRVAPLVNRPGDHLRYAGMSADAFIAEAVSLREQLHPK